MLDFFVEVLKGIASMFIYSWWVFAIILGLFAYQNRRKMTWVRSTENLVLEIKIPKTNDKNPTAAEMMFATLHGILKPKIEVMKEGSIQEHISFEIVADHDSIRFYVWTPKHLKDFIEGQVYAQYPSADIKVTEDYTKKFTEEALKQKEFHLKGTEIVLERDDFLPIKTFNNFQVDPLAGITGVLSKLETRGEEIWIQILARPVSDEWKQDGLNWIKKKRGGSADFNFDSFGKFLLSIPVEIIKAFVFGPGEVKESKDKLSAEEEGRISAIEMKSEKLGYDVKIRAVYLSPTGETSTQKIQAILGTFKQYNTTNLNAFKGKAVHNNAEFLNEYQNRIFMEGGYHLNIEELASIYHLPHTSVETPNINWTTSKTGEPPTTLPTVANTPEDELTPFAETNFRSNRQVFGIKKDDRRRHMYIIGKSGMGKSKLLENLINHDIQKGEGVAVIDPHGDLIAATIAKLPPERINDVIIFDPSDINHPIGFNPMEVIDESLKIQIASGVLGTFKKIFGTSWGPRLEYVFNYTLLALLDTPGSTLLGVVNMLTDKNFRKDIISHIQDPVVKKFWTTEWASYSEKFATEAVAPILNKVGQFTANSLIRNIIGQPFSSFNIRKAMDEGKILLINLSTGKVGETNAALMGAMMITAIQLAAMSRADIPEEERRDFYLYVDEFQNFATESFKVILSEARKYHLNLTMANQYVAQMEDTGVKDAIFGNVGTLISFRVGAGDAGELVREFNEPFEVQDFINLSRQHIYTKMTIDGQAEQAFSAKTLTVSSETTHVQNAVLEHSRKEYTRDRAEVEKEIADASGIEIETIKVGTETEVKIETKDSTIIAGDEGVFEAPLVKRVGKKKPFDKPTQNQALKEAIASSTAHLAKKPEAPKAAQKPAEPKKEPKAEKTQPKKPEVNPVQHLKIKDQIDKETLSEILKKVVTPVEKPEEKSVPKEVERKAEPTPKPKEEIKKENKPVEEKPAEPAPTVDTKILINNTKRLDEKNNENRGEAQKKPAEQPIKKENIVVAPPTPKIEASKPEEKEEAKPEEKQTFNAHRHKSEKIVTPDNFKEITEIHPHEVVKIVSEPKELPEGQSVKFE